MELFYRVLIGRQFQSLFYCFACAVNTKLARPIKLRSVPKFRILTYYLKNEQECFIRFKATSAQREWL